jgi:hypothetical protein
MAVAEKFNGGLFDLYHGLYSGTAAPAFYNHDTTPASPAVAKADGGRCADFFNFSSLPMPALDSVLPTAVGYALMSPWS